MGDDENVRSEERAELAARVAGAAIQHGYGEVASETETDPTFLKRRDSVAKEVAEVAMKKGLVKGDDLASVSFAAINQIALDAASAAIKKGTARDETEPELTEEQKHQHKELAILAAGSAVQHHFGEDAPFDPTHMRRVSSLAEEAAGAAIEKKLVPDERHDPTLADLAEVARHAASAAIQKHLAVEDQETHDEAHDHERQKLAALAASAALQHGHGTEPPNAHSLRTLSDISKSAANAALQKSTSVPADVDEGHFRTAQEAARFAIEHQLIDHPEPPTELVAEVARMAAGAAIQRGLADEAQAEGKIEERKEFLAEIARQAASFAIQRGLGAEVVPDRRRGYELAVLAASAALRRQEQIADANRRVHPAQIAEVARQAAHEAVRLGYGHDESDLMVMPKTPPLADQITSPDTGHIEKTDLADKEQTAPVVSKEVIHREDENEVEDVPQSTFCRCFPSLAAKLKRGPKSQ